MSGASPIKIVLAALDSQYIHSSLSPWCLLAGLRAYCRVPFSAKVIEGSVNEPAEMFVNAIIAEKPDIAGFSCYIWNISSMCRAAQAVKAVFPDCRIVFGGPEVSYRARGFLAESPWCDHVLSGEGELPIALLTEAIYGSTPLSRVPGLSYRDGDGIVEGLPYISDETPPSPYCPEYFAALGGRFAYLETSRGCPFSCAFCLSGREGGVRFFPVERAKSEMLALAGSRARAVKFVDRTFNADRARAREIFSFIIDNYGSAIPAGTRFHFEIGGDLLDDETLSLLTRAPKGSMQLEIGLQSFNPQTLSAVCRKTDTDKLAENIRAVLAPGNIHVHIDLIAGLPYEDLESFRDSFRKAFALRPHMLQLGFLKLLYGAPMRENARDYPCEFSGDPPYEVTSTPWLTPDDIKELHAVDAALGRIYNSGRFKRSLEYILSASGCDCYGFFRGAGLLLSDNAPRLSLDGFTELMFGYARSLPGVDRVRLRDMMALDRLATNSSSSMPAVLRVEDRRLRETRAALESGPDHRPENVRRGVVWLYSEGRAAYCDYISADPITGEYALKYTR